MTTTPRVIANGKLAPALLGRLLAPFRQPSEDVLVGPAPGEDAAVLAVAEGALVVATDPITLTTADVGRYAVVINANDVAVCGVRPRWFLATVLLPAGTDEDAVEALFAAMRPVLDELEVSLVGGHTEVTSAVNQPVVVGQMLGYSADGRFLTTGGASIGDVVVQVGPAPIEGGAVLAGSGLEALESIPDAVVSAAAVGANRPGISVVAPALAAADLGATAMHDPTEGGLAAGLHELAVAANAQVALDRSRIRWFEPAITVCEAVGADPWATLASGCLLATFPAASARGACAELRHRGWEVAEIGAVKAGSGVIDEIGHAVSCPARDEVARLLE